MGNNNVLHAALISPRVNTRLVNVEETSVRAEDRKAQGPVHAKAGVLIKLLLGFRAIQCDLVNADPMSWLIPA
jgi:hypothetical protein